MSLAQDLDPLTPVPSWVRQPNEGDEWWSDEPQMESSLHMEQISLLIACLKGWWQERSRFFVAGNISIYNKNWLKTSSPIWRDCWSSIVTIWLLYATVWKMATPELGHGGEAWSWSVLLKKP